MKNSKLTVFLSHAWKDKLENPAFKIVEEALKENGFKVWVDVAGLLGGEKIRPKLESVIKESDAFVVLWSKAARESKDVNFEIKTAIKCGIKLFPCLIENTDFEGSGLDGRLHYDFMKTAKGIPFNLDKLIKDLNNIILENSEFATENQAINELWAELSHIFHRMSEGVSGNDISNVYLKPAVEKCKKMLSNTQSNDTKKQIKFFEGLSPIMETYPNRFQDAIKKAKLLQLLNKVDSQNSVALISTWKTLMSNFVDEFVYKICLIIDKIYTEIGTTNLDYFISVSYSNRGYALNPNQLDTITQSIIKTIFMVPNILSNLVAASNANNQYQTLMPVLEKIVNYYDNENDYINDNNGFIGLLDDTYFALKFIKTFDDYIQNRNGCKLLNIDLSGCLNDLVFIINENIILALDNEVNSSFTNTNSNLGIWGFINLLINSNDNHSSYSYPNNKKSMLELQVEGALGLY